MRVKLVILKMERRERPNRLIWKEVREGYKLGAFPLDKFKDKI